MRDRPICFHCREVVEHSPVFEAPCGHDQCASASWHGLCLMSWREHLQETAKGVEEMWKAWVEEHTENER